MPPLDSMAYKNASGFTVNIWLILRLIKGMSVWTEGMLRVAMYKEKN